jgi:hypothetical protein
VAPSGQVDSGQSTSTDVAATPAEGPIVLRTMGSLFFGGRVVRDEAGDTYHGDHGYAQYFVPQDARDTALVMWHGLGQSGKTWESTPDGRDGFWQIFTRRDWPVYVIDQPRRGRAGRAVNDDPSNVTHINPSETESAIWRLFRLGHWNPPGERRLFPDAQFSPDERAAEQFFRQQTPNIGPQPFPDRRYSELMAGATAELVGQIGPCALVTHSHSVQYGWVTAMMAPHLVKAIVAFEPGEFAFPDDDAPPELPTTSDVLTEYMAPQFVARQEFMKLTTIPILIIVGDYVVNTPQDNFETELWRMTTARARQFVAAVNANGGDATLLILPEAGIHGNTHFPMSDLNNVEIADIMEHFLSEHGLGVRDHPHRGPVLG